MKLLKSLSIFLLILYLTTVLSACSNGTMGKTQANYNDDVKSGDYVRLNLNYTNSIVRGKDVFYTVMKKYQPIIDFYGADSTVFQNLVNTNLLLDTNKLTSLSENMFNYDSLQAWGDTQFLVEYDDGTRESLPTAEALTITGSPNSNWVKEGKKIIGFLVKLKDVEKVTDWLIDAKYNSIISHINESLFLDPDDFGTTMNRIESLASYTETLTKLSGALVTLGKYAGYAGIALNIAQSVGFVDLGPDQDEIRDKIINAKLDHIIKLIEGMYTHLEYIETKLDQIELVVVTKAKQQLQLDLKSIINTMNGKIQELQNVQSLENKQAIAMNLIQQINGFLQNYIDYSEADYANFIEYQTVYTKDDPEYQPLRIKINIPHRRYYSNREPRRIECTLADFTMKNPNIELPFSYEGLEYMKNLYITRLNTNSFIETDEDKLNNYNSKTALTYLNTSNSYINKLRSKINLAYQDINQELKKTKDNINLSTNLEIDFLLGTFTSEGQKYCTVRDNLNYLKNFLLLMNGGFTSYYEYNGSTTEEPPAFGGTDLFNYRPLFSFSPTLLLGNTGFIVNVNDFPYAASIVFGTNEPVDFLKGVTDDGLLDDANVAIDAYYKAKTNKLLEFAASLAALEIQLAMYLNDEDYTTYAE